MRYELTQRFYFEAAHSLNRQIDAESSRRVHGHTSPARVTLGGAPDPRTGMLVDLALLRRALERVRDTLDHRLLDEVAGLGAPTLENLCAFLWRSLEHEFDSLLRIEVSREASGDSCCLVRTAA